MTPWRGRGLLQIGRTVLAGIADFPDTHAIWEVRFEAMAKWLVDWEAKRSAEIDARHAEIDGRMTIDARPGRS